MPVSLQTKITEYRTQHSDYVTSDQAIIKQLFDSGGLKDVPRAEIEAAMRGSIFSMCDYGYANTGPEGNTPVNNPNRNNNSTSIFHNIISMQQSDSASKTQSDSMISNMTPQRVTDNIAIMQTAKTDSQKPYTPKKSPTEILSEETAVYIFYMLNRKILQDAQQYEIKIDSLAGNNFSDMESAAEALLQKLGKSYTAQDVKDLAKELIIMNSGEDAQTLDEIEQSALDSINNGTLRYIDRDYDIYNNNPTAQWLKNCGIENTPENSHFFEGMYIAMQDIFSGTYSAVFKEIDEIFAKFDKQKEPDIHELHNQLTSVLDKYKGSYLVLDLKKTIDNLVKEDKFKKKDYKQWNDSIRGGLVEYKYNFDDVQKTMRELSEAGVDPETIKRTMLTKHGIILYTEQEQEELQQLRSQNFVAAVLTSVFGSLYESKADLHNCGSLFYNVANFLIERTDDIFNLLGKDFVTNGEDINYLSQMRDIWSTMSCDKTSDENFRQTFKKLFGKEYDENLATDIMNYYSNHQGTDLLKDKTFRKKLTDLLGVDIITNRKISLNIESWSSKIGDIMVMIAGMNAIESSGMITNFTNGTYNYLKALGFSGKALTAATAMASSGASAAMYTVTERTANNIITGQILDSDTMLATLKQTVYSAEFGAFAGALHVLAISPLTEAKPIQEAMQKVNQTLKSGQELSGRELMQLYYEAQEPIIKSKLGQYAYSLAVNTAGAVSFNIVSDIATNGLEPFKNGNAAKYLGDITMENLKLILTFEGVRMILQMQLAGKQGAKAAQEISVEDALKNMDLMKDVTFSATTNPNGTTEFTVNTAQGTIKLGSVSEVIALCCNMMQQEIALGDYMHMHADDESGASELSTEPEKTVLSATEEKAGTKNIKSKTKPTEKPTYYKIISEQLSRVERTVSEHALPLENKLSPLDDAIRTADLGDAAVRSVVMRNLCEKFPSLQKNPYSLTCLRQLQSLINSPEYQDLDEYQREMAKLIILRSTEMVNPDDIIEDAHITEEEVQRIRDLEACLTEDDIEAAIAYVHNINDFVIISAIAAIKEIDVERIEEMIEMYNRSMLESD